MPSPFFSVAALSFCLSPAIRPSPQKVMRSPPFIHSPRCKISSDPRDILVVGAGIVGLTTAIRLREAGHTVVIIAQETPSVRLSPSISSCWYKLPTSYTSHSSHGMWMPSHSGDHNNRRWTSDTYWELIKEAPQHGVEMVEGLLLSGMRKPEQPWFSSLTTTEVVTFEEDSRVPIEYAGALRFTVPVVEMDKYLRHLEWRVGQLNVPIELTQSHTHAGEDTAWNIWRTRAFGEAQFGKNPIVVNCCGMGTRWLTGEDIVPVRHVMFRAKCPKGMRNFVIENWEDASLSEDGWFTYAIPREEEIMLGGSLVLGDWKETATDDEVQYLRKRAGKLIGKDTFDEMGSWTAVMPVRPCGKGVVQIEDGPHGVLVSNLGHGRNSVTVSWGCANDVTRLVEKL